MDLVIIANPHDLNAIQEGWFIQNIIFKGAQIVVGYSPGRVKNKTVVYLELNEVSPELIAALRADNNRVILYHMGDEFFKMSREHYKSCDLVIRNYYSNKIFGENQKILWAPCGYKTGVGPRDSDVLRSALDRKWVAAFFGWLENSNSFNNERAEFASIAGQCGDSLFIIPSEAFSGGINTMLYAAFMEDAIFAPCPAGNSPETIRLFDALECGCIPILLKHDFIFSSNAMATFSVPPFIFLESWSQLPNLLLKMRALFECNSTEIFNQQSDCIRWWRDYKALHVSRINNSILSVQ